MAVAKSYVDLEKIGNPFEENNRMYILVRLKSGKEKKVRWYTDQEYQKLYHEAPTKKEPCAFKNDPYHPYKYPRPMDDGFVRSEPLFHTLGFGEKHYIWIFKNVDESHDEYFKRIGCTYRRNWKWGYTEAEPPADLPKGVVPVKLYWDKVAIDPDKMMPDEQMLANIEELLYDSIGEYQGQIGERLELDVEVEKVLLIENDFAVSRIFVLKDDNNNFYTWKTQAKSWEVGSRHHIRGTVKQHKKYKGECTTVLTRCRES